MPRFAPRERRRIGWMAATATVLALAPTVILAAENPFALRRPAMPVLEIGAASTDPRIAFRGETPALDRRAPSGTSGSFVSAYLTPRMTSRLGGYGRIVGSALYDAEPAASAWRSDVERSIERGALGAARGAAREYLVDRWNLELGLRRGDHGLAVGRSLDPRSSGIRLGFAGMRPRLTWQAPTRTGALKVSLDAAGRLGAAWRHHEARSASLFVSAEPMRRSLDAGWSRSF